MSYEEMQSKSDHTIKQVVGVDPIHGVICKDDLIERAIASNTAIIEGRLKNVKTIRSEVGNWKSGLNKK